MMSALERFRETLSGYINKPKSATIWIMKYKGERIITLKGKSTWEKKGFARASLRNILSYDMYWASHDIYNEYGHDAKKRKELIEADFKEFVKEVEFLQITEDKE